MRNLTAKDAETLATFKEFLERAGTPPPPDGSSDWKPSPGLKRMLKTKKWRRYLGLDRVEADRKRPSR